MKIQNRSGKLLLATLVLSAASGCSGITNLNKTAEPELDSSTANAGIFSDPDTTPADDSPYAHSPRRQVGHGFSIEIFGLNSNRQGSNDKSQLENGSAGRNSRLTRNGKHNRRKQRALPEVLVSSTLITERRLAGSALLFFL